MGSTYSARKRRRSESCTNPKTTVVAVETATNDAPEAEAIPVILDCQILFGRKLRQEASSPRTGRKFTNERRNTDPGPEIARCKHRLLKKRNTDISVTTSSWDDSMKETKDILAKTAMRITSLKSRVEDAHAQRMNYSITQTCTSTTAISSNEIDKFYAASRGRACSGLTGLVSSPNTPILKVTRKTNNCLRWMDDTNQGEDPPVKKHALSPKSTTSSSNLPREDRVLKLLQTT
eukprot:m.110158 g.110158  ORF g.110158 m.110158 type:complete len:234 (-) comp16974_c0_seq2:115-816(-)